MKKDYYTLREIILGLRAEYLIHQESLQNLKKFCEIDKKKVLDFNFYVYQPEQKNPMLFCEYIQKQNKIQKLITDYSKIAGYYIYGRNTARLVTDNNRYYFLCGMKAYPVHVKYDYGIDLEFSNYVNFILKSEFSNNMRSEYIEDNNLGINAAFTIDSTMVRLYVRNKSSEIPSSIVLYDSRKDDIEFISFEEQISKQYMEKVLNIAFSSEKLNDYYIKTIADSEESEKSIVLEDFDLTDMVKFNIQDKGKNYVLKKAHK